MESEAWTKGPDEEADEKQNHDDHDQALARYASPNASSDRIVQDSRWLILSMHRGSEKDKAMHIHSAGVRQENHCIICVSVADARVSRRDFSVSSRRETY